MDADLADRAEVLKVIGQDVASHVKACKVLESSMKDAMKGLASAIKSNDLESVEKALVTLRDQMLKLGDKALNGWHPLHDRIKDLPVLAKPAPKEQALCDKLLDMLGSAATTGEQLVAKARQLQYKADDFLQGVVKDAKAVEQALTVLDANLSKSAQVLPKLTKRLAEIDLEVKFALRQRDEILLIKAQDRAKEALGTTEAHTSFQQKLYSEFERRCLGPQFSAGQVARWKKELDRLRERAKTHEGEMKALGEQARKLMEAKVEEIDAKKAAGVVEIESRHAAELAQAIKGDESSVRKKLDALAKKAKSALSGKEMFERLRRAKMA